VVTSSKFFDLAFLRKTLLELESSLHQEFEGIQQEFPKLITKSVRSIWERYSTAKSLAGMEIFCVGFRETIYFHELSDELKIGTSIQHIIESLQENLGTEDIRMRAFDQVGSDFELSQLLLQFAKESEKNFKEFQSQYLPENWELGISLYFANKKDPKKNGWKSIDPKQSKPPTPLVEKLIEASKILKHSWPSGWERSRILTSKIIGYTSPGLVSFSFYHEPGISYLNLKDRSLLEIIDDIVHESAHHHLNLILKKYKIMKKAPELDIYYSPWRKALRPIYAILHACFTFSVGADLFYHLHKDDSLKIHHSKFLIRLGEEILQNQYSLEDLISSSKSFTPRGISLLNELDSMNQLHESYFKKQFPTLSAKDQKNWNSLKKELRNKRKEFKIR
jgi:hypothetical protein